MKPTHFKAEQAYMQLNNPQMAQLCNVSVRTIERWRSGSVQIPNTAARLIEVYQTLRTSHQDVMDHMKRKYEV